MILLLIKYNFAEFYQNFDKGKLIHHLLETIQLRKNEIDPLFLFEISQCLILLITNILVTLKIELAKNKVFIIFQLKRTIN